MPHCRPPQTGKRRSAGLWKDKSKIGRGECRPPLIFPKDSRLG